MASTISAGTTTGTAIAIAGDTSGSLQLQTNGTTTAVTISTAQVVTLAQPLPVASGGSGVTTSTGTGANVLGTSPTLTTPVINGFTGDTSVINIGSGQVYKDASGNVGIGTSSPASYSKLAVLGSDGTGFTGITAINSNANVGIAGVQFSSDTTYVKAAIGLLRSDANGKGSLVFYNDSNADAANWSTGDEKMRIDTSGNLLFNSGYGSVATAYGCRAWVNFNGTGTVAIRASGNVSSITDNGTGDYTVNFTTAMVDANYSTVGTSASAANTGKVVMYIATVPTVSLVRIFNDIASNLTGQDSTIMNVAIFR